MADNNEVAVADAGGGDAVAEANAPDVAAQPNMWTILKGLVSRMLIIYFISSMVRSWSGSPPPNMAKNSTEVGPDGSALPSTNVRSMPAARNIFNKGFMFDLHVYLADTPDKFTDFEDSSKLFWLQKDLEYGDWTSGENGDGQYTVSKTIPTTTQLQNNGSLYIHIFIVAAGDSPNPTSHSYNKRFMIYRTRRLNKYKRKTYRNTANLLTGETAKSEEDQRKAETIQSEILSHWHPNMTINLIEDYTAWQQGVLPPPLDEYIDFDAMASSYYPIFYFNDYWNLGVDYMPLNDTVKEVNFTLTYQPMGLFKWQLYASQQMRNKWSAMFSGEEGQEDNDQDSIKQALLETSPYLLGITMVASLLHTVFEFLAFKNDIQFWRNRKSLEGLSVRSVLFTVFSSLIVLLYVMDHDTNFMVKVSIGIGLLIELWKVPKCMDVSIDWHNKWLGICPRLVLADKGSYVQSATKEYDQQAFRYLSWLLYPLLACYCVYSLIYEEHKGWYSWVLSIAYGFLLTFGFIMMTPQLFINYKLKSVAHLPWRMLSYKFINTFIDDLFAFVIRMPTLYRLGCFRDDIVFLVYVYQRWIYRVDPTRLNEFGTTGLDPMGTGAEGEGQNGALVEGNGEGNMIEGPQGEGDAGHSSDKCDTPKKSPKGKKKGETKKNK